MKFKNCGAELFVPDREPVPEAIGRTTHMAIAAHQDDLEIMAYHGILQCFAKADQWFMGVVVGDGSGSARANLYAEYCDEAMRRVRRAEQKKAAYVGEYGALALLDYPSCQVKDSMNCDILEELSEIVAAARPEVIYTHNLADKHDTHVSVALRTIQALRRLPEALRPERIYGCEVWRGLDWMNDEDKVMFDVSSRPNLAAALIGVHDSQIGGGKRYDLATAGRRLANATYLEAHGVDEASAYIWGMNLKPLVDNPALDIDAYVQDYIRRFSLDVSERLMRLLKTE
ncbi:LmbE family N-acetylglucosaminyl deacetylase [Hydrogenispora ethanolica]|uniref:LmbE family N-acetylglucosaminyl deacetylase n=1 Tax=Hydrogenispora ethanolica TaxID=1082276 RepID=A0A4R1RAQ4_HYDET|nr:PIG-L family deacetylase [Hydrogenispora ethanolica]TCL62796.1 LmbE family N-acetylglucosaminyl deacetylase [Hydrogenispora ethanolica]